MANNEMVFSVSNMKCAGCVSAVEDAVKALDGIGEVNVSLEKNQAIIKSSETANALIKVITDAGFPAKLA